MWQSWLVIWLMLAVGCWSRQPLFLSPGDGAMIHLRDDGTAVVPFQFSRVPGAGFVRISVVGVGQRFSHDAPFPLDASLTPISVPITFGSAGTYSISAAISRGVHDEEDPADCSDITLELLPRAPLRLFPPANWLLADSVEATVVDWTSLGRNPLRLGFVGDLGPTDGMKVVLLQQFEHLPRKYFEMKHLDLSCADTDDLPFVEHLSANNIPLHRICTTVLMDPDEFKSALAQMKGFDSFSQVHPLVQQSLAPLFHFLSDVDVVVMSNSAGASDNYIFEVARFAGVSVRILDLGAKLFPNAEISATAFLAPSHFVKLHPRVRSENVPTYVISPAVDLEHFKRARCPPIPFADKSLTVVGYVGRLAAEKSPGLFLHAAAALQNRMNDTEFLFLIIGDGPLRTALQHLAARLHIRAHFAGFVAHKEIVCHLQVMDALVLPSVSTETFGIVGVEAMALGVPIVGFGIGGVTEYMDHETTALVATTVEASALADNVAALLTDTTMYNLLSESGMALVQRSFSIVPVINRYIKFYFLLVSTALNSKCTPGVSQMQTPNHRLNVALHAQVSSKSSGMVVGSEITCAGFKNSFEALDHQVEHVEVFYPFEYVNLTARNWDLVLIEGWFEMIHAFIHEVRRISQGRARVFFYCLDPDLPGMDEVVKLDVDGFFTSSNQMKGLLKSAAPTQLLLLAADPAFMQPQVQTEFVTEKYAHNVTYVGSSAGMFAKVNLTWMLQEAIPFGLVIYGAGWQNFPEFAPFWRGTLPKNDLPIVYSASRAVLGATMDTQRDFGMVNNRVFEALSCGAVLITESFDELRDLCGDLVRHVYRQGDVTRHLTELLDGPQPSRAEGRDFVNRHHTYTHRVDTIMQFFRSLPALPSPIDPCSRSNCPKLVILWQTTNVSELMLAFHELSFMPAVSRLRAWYDITFVDFEQVVAFEQPEASTFFAPFHFLLALSAVGGDIDSFVRLKLPRNVEARPRTGLVLFGSGIPKSSSEADAYDAIYYSSEREAAELRLVHPTLQQAFGIDHEILAQQKMHMFVDALCISRFIEAKPLAQFARKRGYRVVIGTARDASASPGAVRMLRRRGVTVLLHPETAVVIQMIRSARLLVLVGYYGTETDWLLMAAQASGVPVEAMPQFSHVMQDYLLGSKPWDAAHYGSMLHLGLSRMMCYGAGTSAVSVVRARIR
jgi:glycosyltransferase involved in cell wall biosynthesis